MTFYRKTFRGWRGRRSRSPWLAGGLLGLCVALLYPAVLAGRLLSPSGMLFTLPPWSAYAPTSGDRLEFNDVNSDATFQFDPWHALTLDAVRRGQWPLWNPYSYAGAPLAANMQSSVYFPLDLLVWAWPTLWVYSLSDLLKLWLSGWFTYLFLVGVRLEPPAAMLGALGVMGGGFLTVWMVHPHTQSALALPMMFWAIERWRQRPVVSTWSVIAMSSGLGWLGGHPETALHAVVTAGAYGLFRVVSAPTRRLFCAGALVLGLLAGLALSAVQLLPFAEYLSHGHVLEARTSTAYDDGHPWGAAVLLLVPNFFGEHERFTWWETDVNRVAGSFNELAGHSGLAATLLALVALRGWSRRRELRFFWVLIGLCLLLIYSKSVHDHLFNHVPLFNFTSQTRLLFELGFGVSVAGAFGLDRLLRLTRFGKDRTRREERWLILGTTALVVIIAAFWGSYRLFAGAQIRDPAFDLWSGLAVGCLAAYLTLLAVVVRQPRGQRQRWAWALVALAAVELWVWDRDYIGTVRETDLYAATAMTDALLADTEAGRLFSVGQVLAADLHAPYGLRSVEGYDVVEVERYWPHLEQLRQSEFQLHGGAIPEDLRDLLDRLSVRHLVTDPGRTVVGRDLEMIHDGRDGRVFRNTTSWPRNFWVSRTEFEAGRIAPEALGVVTVLRDDPLAVAHHVVAPEAGYLVLLDVHYPGWHVEVDGHPAEIESALGAFRAVATAEGEHEVHWRYRPRSFRIGAWLSLVTLVVLGGLAMVRPGRRLPRQWTG